MDAPQRFRMAVEKAGGVAAVAKLLDCSRADPLATQIINADSAEAAMAVIREIAARDPGRVSAGPKFWEAA
jgi:hypothetical protein